MELKNQVVPPAGITETDPRIGGTRIGEDHAPVPHGTDPRDSPSEELLQALLACDRADPRFETAADPRIPAGQMYFKIGEVSKITGIKPYVLRYWEVEFPWIRPEKTSSRQRRYRRQDIALLFRIGRLRYEEDLTIERTRQIIREERLQQGAHARDRGLRAGKDLRRRLNPGASGGAAPLSPEEVGRGEAGQLSLGLSGAARSTHLRRALADMRKTVLELLESVEE